MRAALRVRHACKASMLPGTRYPRLPGSPWGEHGSALPACVLLLAWQRPVRELGGARRRRGSPLSQAVTLRQMHEGKGKTLAECLRMDFRLVTRFCRGPSDFVEGVRALLIDKCGKPSWDPPHIDQARHALAAETGAQLICSQEV